MLSETKTNLQELINKLQVLDFTIDTTGRLHKDNEEIAGVYLKRICAHKVKLIDEVLRLNGVE